jgi:hypothetical protein
MVEETEKSGLRSAPFTDATKEGGELGDEGSRIARVDFGTSLLARLGSPPSQPLSLLAIRPAALIGPRASLTPAQGLEKVDRLRRRTETLGFEASGKTCTVALITGLPRQDGLPDSPELCGIGPQAFGENGDQGSPGGPIPGEAKGCEEIGLLFLSRHKDAQHEGTACRA